MVHVCNISSSILPYFGKRKQVTYHLDLIDVFVFYPVCSSSRPNLMHKHSILLRDMLGKTSWYSIDVSGYDRYLLFYKKCPFCLLLPFAIAGQYCQQVDPLIRKTYLYWPLTPHGPGAWLRLRNQCHRPRQPCQLLVPDTPGLAGESQYWKCSLGNKTIIWMKVNKVSRTLIMCG